MDLRKLNVFSVIVEGGSGCLIQPSTGEYSYILTAKHLIKGKTKSRIKIVRQFLSKGNVVNQPLKVQEIYLHSDQNKDAAILKIDFIQGLGNLFTLPAKDIFNAEEYYLTGHPGKRRKKKEYSFRVNELTPKNTVEHDYIEAKVEDRPSYNEVNGQSGGGIIKASNGKYLLAGIQSEMAAKDIYELMGRVKIMPISFFEEIISEYPHDLKKLVSLDENDLAIFNYKARLLRNTEKVDYRGFIKGNNTFSSITTLPFDEVYITPTIIPQQLAAEWQTEKEQLLQRILSGNMATIEERSQLEEEYAQLSYAEWQPSTKLAAKDNTIGEMLKQTRHSVLIGAPGVGKSILSRFIIRIYARETSVMFDLFGWSENMIPILVKVADFADELNKNPHLKLSEFIFQLMHNFSVSGLEQAANENLLNGSAIIIIEGIDEASDYPARIQVTRAVDEFIDEYSANRILVTSRPSGYIPLKSQILHYKLSSFSFDQIRHFIAKLYGALERHRLDKKPPNFEKASYESNEFFNEIVRRTSLMEFATNPLLLTLLILLRKRGIQLPARRILVYQLSVELLMELWNYWRRERSSPTASRLAGGLSTNDLLRLWAAMAEWAHRHRPTGVLYKQIIIRELERIISERHLVGEGNFIDIDAYLEAASNRAVILEERAKDLFAFWHPTFEEYLSAVELSLPLTRAKDRLLELRNDARWREVIFLAVANIGTIQHDENLATEIVSALADDSPDPVWEPIVHTNLRLAVDCISDKPGVALAVVEKLIIRLSKAIHNLPYDSLADSFIIAVSKLSDLKISPEAVDTLVPLVSNSNDLVRREIARLFSNVANINPVARKHCQSMFEDSYYEVRYLAALGLAKAGNHSYEVWRMLMSFGVMRDIDPELYEYLESGEPQAAETLKKCLSSKFQDIRFRATRFLLAMDKVDEKVIDTLICSLAMEDIMEWEICERLIINLLHQGIITLDKIRYFLNDDLDDVRFGVANFLYKHEIRDQKVIQAISLCLESENLSVRWQAADLLWKHGIDSIAVKDASLTCLDSESLSLRGAAASTLIKMNHAYERVIETNLQDLAGPKPINSAKRLLGIGKERERVLSVLRENLSHDNLMTRAESAVELIEQGEWTDSIIAALKSCLWSDNPHVQFKAWWYLNDKGITEGILEALVKKLPARGNFLRGYAKEHIKSFVEKANLEKDFIEEVLLTLLVDKDLQIQLNSAELLLEWGLGIEQSLRVLIGFVSQDIDKDTAVFIKILNHQNLLVKDGKRVIKLLQNQADCSSNEQNARSLIYNWMWQLLNK